MPPSGPTPSCPFEVGTVVDVFDALGPTRGKRCLVLEVLSWPRNDTAAHRRCVDITKGVDVQFGDLLWWGEGMLWVSRPRCGGSREDSDVGSGLWAIRPLGKFYAAKR